MNEIAHIENLLAIPSLATERLAVTSTTLDALFKAQRIPAIDGSEIFGRLHLPEYQRPYRWEPTQLARLLDDLRTFFSNDDLQDFHQPHDFYLGSIILHQEGGNARQRGRLNIIDGQQRLTSLALLHYMQHGNKGAPDLRYSSPESQKRIRRNLAWLGQQALPWIDFTRVNISLVVTRSEDDAYRFFETQNTSGVRLGGADIIKAHHLRTIPNANQDDYARAWESLHDLEPLVATLMKSRHWQKLRWRNVASDRDPLAERNEIVHELAERTQAGGPDVAYRTARIETGADGAVSQVTEPGYDMRQPLSTGINAIRYIEYFHDLRESIFGPMKNAAPGSFESLYNRLSVDAGGSVFLSRIYDCAMLLYVNQFGKARILEASLWLFRMVFSLRLINEVSVREDGAQSFVRQQPVLDWIATSHSHEQLMEYLHAYKYVASPEGLDRNSIKKRFIKSVEITMGLELPWENVTDIPAVYDARLREAIDRFCLKSSALQGNSP